MGIVDFNSEPGSLDDFVDLDVIVVVLVGEDDVGVSDVVLEFDSRFEFGPQGVGSAGFQARNIDGTRGRRVITNIRVVDRVNSDVEGASFKETSINKEITGVGGHVRKFGDVKGALPVGFNLAANILRDLTSLHGDLEGGSVVGGGLSVVTEGEKLDVEPSVLLGQDGNVHDIVCVVTILKGVVSRNSGLKDGRDGLLGNVSVELHVGKVGGCAGFDEEEICSGSQAAIAEDIFEEGRASVLVVIRLTIVANKVSELIGRSGTVKESKADTRFLIRFNHKV